MERIVTVCPSSGLLSIYIYNRLTHSSIKEDFHPEWKVGKSHERRKSAYKLNSKISNSINYDFGEYTPNIDDSLEDGIISFRVFGGNDDGKQ